MIREKYNETEDVVSPVVACCILIIVAASVFILLLLGCYSIFLYIFIDDDPGMKI